ncbi:MAG: hypothetical protein U9Q92_06225 [archaeon]|nr:hypothetical protein [archaeon]
MKVMEDTVTLYVLESDLGGLKEIVQNYFDNTRVNRKTTSDTSSDMSFYEATMNERTELNQDTESTIKDILGSVLIPDISECARETGQTEEHVRNVFESLLEKRKITLFTDKYDGLLPIEKAIYKRPTNHGVIKMEVSPGEYSIIEKAIGNGNYTIGEAMTWIAQNKLHDTEGTTLIDSEVIPFKTDSRKKLVTPVTKELVEYRRGKTKYKDKDRILVEGYFLNKKGELVALKDNLPQIYEVAKTIIVPDYAKAILKVQDITEIPETLIIKQIPHRKKTKERTFNRLSERVEALKENGYSPLLS